jgi:cytochrome c5
MSDAHQTEAEEHNPGIKTPRQLIVVVAAAFIVPIVVIIMLTQFVTLGNKEAPGSFALSPSEVAARIAPIGAVKVSNPNDVAAARSGQQVFEAQCTTCHTAGALGAPKFGDAAAWGPRIAQGYPALLNSALHGKGNMPAQGGGDFSDFEIGRAVVYMADKGGANFAEPKPPVAASAPEGGASEAVSSVAAAAGSAPASASNKQ